MISHQALRVAWWTTIETMVCIAQRAECPQVKAKPKARRRAMLELTPEATPEGENNETGPITFDSYASKVNPFDAWWSKGTFDDWESKGSSSFDTWWSKGNDAEDLWQTEKWVPGAKLEPDEKWFNIRADQNEGDQNEDSKNAKIGAQGRT